MLGGTIGLAISSTVLNNYLGDHLPHLLNPDEIQKISASLQYINELPIESRDAVRQTFSDGYNAQLRVMMAFSGTVFLATFVLWERNLKRSKDIQEGY